MIKDSDRRVSRRLLRGACTTHFALCQGKSHVRFFDHAWWNDALRRSWSSGGGVSEPRDDSAVQGDLVMLTVGGVQPFIAESRKTADAAGASVVVRQVVAAAALSVRDALAAHDKPYGLVIPDPGALIDDGERVPVGISNKIVYLAPPNTGATVAEAAVKEAGRQWTSLVAETHGSIPPTPGMPDLAWVSVAGEIGNDGYRELWSTAARALDQRKRTRWFEVSRTTSKTLCAQSPLLPSVTAPRGRDAMSVPKHERHEQLSAAGWVKRHVGNTIYGLGSRFPATTVVASSWFRDQLIRRAVESPNLRGELVPLVQRMSELAPSDDMKHVGLPTSVPPGFGGAVDDSRHAD
ncbi:hypothetical protein MOQ72_40095 [Saccharopolyspora sp. K220]|uniref:type III-B CRISPR-associated protein Cas10/Cmr2 n=1 Tax=Saccharopolyspora soli TaxID=2926618 RepID=UPI001F588BC8|nr:type III-B CRISPR-associated protein Cas10/Cmr2 [Saccharopolyspora soli]MCI2423626.1 hypothetical protein [Saccharopolyspora soli]